MKKYLKDEIRKAFILALNIFMIVIIYAAVYESDMWSIIGMRLELGVTLASDHYTFDLGGALLFVLTVFVYQEIKIFLKTLLKTYGPEVKDDVTSWLEGTKIYWRIIDKLGLE